MEQMQNPFPTFHQVMKGKFTGEDLWITPTVSLVRLSPKSSLIVLFLYQLFLGGLEANFHSHTSGMKNSRILAWGRQMPRISGHDLCIKKAWYFWFPTSQAESFPWLQESTQSTILYSRKSNSKFAFYLSQIHPKCWSTFFPSVCTRTFQEERDWKPTFGKNTNFQL